MRPIIALVLAATLSAQAPPPAQVGDLGWLSGRWEAGDAERWTEESWSAPRAGVLLGFSRSGRGEALREFELLRIQAGEDGVPVYAASPQGGATTAFRLTAAGGSEATFENPAHDYPQRIHYRRDGDALVATISAIDGSNPRRWTYRRQ